MVNHEHNKISNNDIPVKIDGMKTVQKALFVGTASEVGLKDLERVMLDLKKEGYWIEECTFQSFRPALDMLRDGLTEQITKILQEICPDVQVHFIDDKPEPWAPRVYMDIFDEAAELPDGLDYQGYPSKEHEGT